MNSLLGCFQALVVNLRKEYTYIYMLQTVYTNRLCINYGNRPILLFMVVDTITQKQSKKNKKTAVMKQMVGQ